MIVKACSSIINLYYCTIYTSSYFLVLIILNNFCRFLGVEFAAELRDFVKEDLRKIFPDEMIEKSTITLIDGLNKILNSYSDEVNILLIP